jgi:uncharacterized protein (TIGR03435 family)
MQPDSLAIRGSSIQDVIEFAYAVPSDNELSSSPSWIRAEKFDITAKPDQAEALVLSKLSSTDLRTQMRLMVQLLLEERLHLKVSFAMKDLPLFALVVAKGGFKCTKCGTRTRWCTQTNTACSERTAATAASASRLCAADTDPRTRARTGDTLGAAWMAFLDDSDVDHPPA